MKFETFIFDNYYTVFDKLTDPNKDVDGKGTQERFCETIGATIDDTVPFIDDLNKNVLVPTTRLNSMVGYAEEELGYLSQWIWFYEEPISFRKYLTGIMPRLLEIRSTVLAMDVMFAWIGCTMVLAADFNYDGGFDSPLTLDSPQRRFDSYTNTLIPYTVALTGPTVFGSVYDPNPPSNVVRIIHAIYTILLFNQPVNAILTTITYNGIDIHQYFGSITPFYLLTTFQGGLPYTLPFILP